METSLITLSGKTSTFGGPKDMGVSASEGLALIEPEDLTDPRFAELFLPDQPPGTHGLARRLNPEMFYCAMRWAYKSDDVNQDRGEGKMLPITTSRALLRHGGKILVKANGLACEVQPVDWGPGIEDRLIDVSPGVFQFLGLQTDDEVTVILPW